MSRWKELRRWLRGQPPGIAHLRAERGAVVALREALAKLEAVDSFWEKRLETAEEEEARWEPRLALAGEDEELQAAVEAILAEIGRSVSRARQGLVGASRSVATVEDKFLTKRAELETYIREAEAYGYRPTEVHLDIDEDAMRENAIRVFAEEMPKHEPILDPFREHLERLFQGMENPSQPLQ